MSERTIVPFSPVGRGFLAGGVPDAAALDSTDFRSGMPRFQGDALAANLRFAESLGAKVVRMKGRSVADSVADFVRSKHITHVIFGQSARNRLEILMKGSTLNRFLQEVRDAAVQVVPLDQS